MRKKTFLTVVFGIVLTVSLCLYGNFQPVSASTSNLLDANIEALADGESSKSCSAVAYCSSSYYYASKGEYEAVNNGAVSCTGEEECISGAGYVICDGSISSCQ